MRQCKEVIWIILCYRNYCVYIEGVKVLSLKNVESKHICLAVSLYLHFPRHFCTRLDTIITITIHYSHRTPAYFYVYTLLHWIILESFVILQHIMQNTMHSLNSDVLANWINSKHRWFYFVCRYTFNETLFHSTFLLES